MRRFLSYLFYLIALAICSAIYSQELAAQDWTASIPYTEGFDDDSHYTGDASLPNGWLAVGSNTFYTTHQDDWTTKAVSGERYIWAHPSYSSKRKDIAFSPLMKMKGGSEYTVSLYLYMPGGARNSSFKMTVGNAQDETAHTNVLAERTDTRITQWEKIEVKFTPETDGEYCFGLWACSVLSNDGFFGIDEFVIDGEPYEEIPEEPEWEASIPYIESFDDKTHYSGNEFLPIGWFSSGEYPFFTANINGVAAVTGEYYMVTTTSILVSRQDIAYTPLLEMKAGQEYNVSFYLYMPGEGNPGKFKFTVGQEQAYDMHENVLLEIKDRKITKWEKQEITFTPESDGKYCFAFWACSETPFDGYFAIDDFVLRKADDIVKPSCNFQYGNTLYSIFEGNTCIFNGQSIKLINLSDNADTYTWSVNNGGQISDENAKDPELIINESGSYEITLTATNKGGSATAKKTLHITVFEEGESLSDAWTTTNDATDKIFSQNDLPSYKEDGSIQDYNTYEVYYDYAVGVSDYYKCFAERFVLPHNQEITVNSVSINVLMYNLHIRTVADYVDDSKKEFSMIIYGEKDGKPDTENPLGTVRKTLAEVFGDAGYYQPVRHSIHFDEPVKVKGTFYVALEFDELTLHPEGTVIERTFFGADTRYHLNNETTLYVKPEKAIPGSDFTVTGEYCKADEFCPALKGYSFGATPWIDIDKIVTDINESFTNELYISVDRNELKVSDLTAGDNISIYSVSGQLMWKGKATDTEVYVSTSSWNNGVYIISVNGKSAKFII